MNLKLFIIFGLILKVQLINSSVIKIESLNTLNDENIHLKEINNEKFNKTFNIDLKEIKFYESRKYKFGNYLNDLF